MEKNAKIEQTEEFIFSFQTEKCLWDELAKVLPKTLSFFFF